MKKTYHKHCILCLKPCLSMYLTTAARICSETLANLFIPCLAPLITLVPPWKDITTFQADRLKTDKPHLLPLSLRTFYLMLSLEQVSQTEMCSEARRYRNRKQVQSDVCTVGLVGTLTEEKGQGLTAEPEVCWKVQELWGHGWQPPGPWSSGQMRQQDFCKNEPSRYSASSVCQAQHSVLCMCLLLNPQNNQQLLAAQNHRGRKIKSEIWA